MDVPHPGPAPAGLSRRSLIKRGLLGGALLAAGGRGVPRAPRWGDGPCARRRAPGVHRGAVRGPRRRGPADGATPSRAGPSVDQVGVARAADRIAARVEPSAQKELQQLLGPVRERARGVPLRRPHPALHPAGRRRAGRGARRVARQPDRGAAHRATPRSAPWCSRATTSRPAVWPAMGYGGPPGHLRGWALAPRVEGGDEPRPDGNGVWHGEPLP